MERNNQPINNLNREKMAFDFKNTFKIGQKVYINYKTKYIDTSEERIIEDFHFLPYQGYLAKLSDLKRFVHVDCLTLITNPNI